MIIKFVRLFYNYFCHVLSIYCFSQFVKKSCQNLGRQELPSTGFYELETRRKIEPIQGKIASVQGKS